MSEGLDPALAALLTDPRLSLRRPPVGVTIEQFRAAANAFMARAPRPTVFASSDHLITTNEGSLRVRLIQPSERAGLPVLLFIHGGGFVLGSLDSHAAMARTLALTANAVVAAVDYRLAPEHPFPAALDDCLAALRHLVSGALPIDHDASRIAIAGDSAGAQLALMTALSQAAPLRHLGLIYPLLDPTRGSASWRTLGTDFMLTDDFVDWAWESYAQGEDPFSSHGIGEVLRGLPPTSIVTAEFDPLRDEGKYLVDRLRAARVEVEHQRYPGMIHGFAGLAHVVPEAAAACLDWIGRRIGQALAN